VTLPAHVRQAVVAHARQAEPAECCGLLLGRDGQVFEAVRARNLDPNPNRFLIDPKDHLDALRRARASGMDVVGFYHSHPRTEACPSERDLAEASYADFVHLIVSLRYQEPELRAFRIERQTFLEVPLSEPLEADDVGQYGPPDRT
jgi:proteasome lid subunit RPN8/RPN11